MIYTEITAKNNLETFRQAEQEASNEILRRRKGHLDQRRGALNKYSKDSLQSKGIIPPNISDKELIEQGYQGLINMSQGDPVEYSNGVFYSNNYYVIEKYIPKNIQILAKGGVIDSDKVHIFLSDGKLIAQDKESLRNAVITLAQATKMQAQSEYYQVSKTIDNLPANTSVGMGIGTSIYKASAKIGVMYNKNDKGELIRTRGIFAGLKDLKIKGKSLSVGSTGPIIERADDDKINEEEIGGVNVAVNGEATLFGNGLVLNKSRNLNSGFTSDTTLNSTAGVEPSGGLSFYGSIYDRQKVPSPMGKDVLQLIKDQYGQYYYQLDILTYRLNNPNATNVYVNNHTGTYLIAEKSKYMGWNAIKGLTEKEEGYVKDSVIENDYIPDSTNGGEEIDDKKKPPK